MRFACLFQPDRLCGPPSLPFSGYRGYSGRGLNLTAHFHRCTKIKNEQSHIYTPSPSIYSDNFILPFIFSTLVVMLQHLMQFFLTEQAAIPRRIYNGLLSGRVTLKYQPIKWPYILWIERLQSKLQPAVC